MEKSLEKSSGVGGTQISRKTKRLDLQTIYKANEEGSSKKRKNGKVNEGKVRDGNKKKRKSVKELSIDRLDQGETKSRKNSDEGDGSQLGSRSESVSGGMNGGLSAFSYKNGLNGVPLSFGGSGNVLRIPKRPRGFVGRRKFEGDRNSKVSGSSSTTFQVGRITTELRKAESSASSGAEAADKREVELHTGAVGSKMKQKSAVGDVKEGGNSRVSSAGPSKEEDVNLVANNADVSSKKTRSNSRKRKDLASAGDPSVKKAEASVDNVGNTSDGFREEDDDEENLEQNAARMLSSRFDPSCTGFSSKSKSSRPSENGVSLSVSSGLEFVSNRSESLAGVEIESADAASRTLRPRKQHNEKGKTRKRRHFYEIVASNFDAEWFLNRRIKVFWPLDESWYYGLVNNYDPDSQLHHVKYDDRDEEWINLQHEKFKLLLLPSEVPGRRERRRSSMSGKHANTGKTELSADEDSFAGTYLDSEPIISWLARSSRRVKSSPSNCLKKQKTSQMSSSVGPSLMHIETLDLDGDVGPSAKDGSKSDCASVLPDRSTDVERLENSLMGSPSSSTTTNFVVYVRRRLRKNRHVPVSGIENASCSPPGTFISPAPVETLQNATQSKNLFWSTDDQGLIRLIIPATECRSLSFRLCSSVLPFLQYPFKAEKLWLSCVSLLRRYGTIVSAWPDVVLEILFVDNIVGLRFLLFEGCLKHAVALFSLILTVFDQPQGNCMLHKMQLPVTSIRFKFSAKTNCWKHQVFTFYSFSKLRPSKWLYLDSKLQSRCLLRQLPLTDCTYDNLKSFEGGSHQINIPCSEAGPSQFKKKFVSSILPVGVPREYASTRMHQPAFGSATQCRKLPGFAVSFTAAPSFFLSLHLKLLMERTLASVSFQDKSLLPSVDSEVASQLISVGLPGAEFCLENVEPIIPTNALGSSLKETITEVAFCAEPHSRICLVSGTKNRIKATQDIASDINMDLSSGYKNFEKKATDTTTKPHRNDSSVKDLEPFAASSAPSSKSVLSPGFVGSYSGVTGLKVQLPCLYESDKASDRGVKISGEASSFKGNRSDVQSTYPAGFSSSWFHDSIVSNSPCGDLSPVWHGRSTLIQGGFGNGPKKPRTQVQYTLPPGGYDFSSKHKTHNQRAPPYKRIRRSNEKSTHESLKGSLKNLELLGCDANVLVTLREKGWREAGARVVVEPTDHNEWVLAVKVSGVTKYSYKVNHILQPGSTNRYTHAMMWKGGKDWMLEFPDRSQWILFKEIYEECHNRNIRAASVKNIPIPGVRMIEESDDCANEPLFVRNSPRYFHQVESDVEMALNPSRFLYDMDSDDEQWMTVTRESMCNSENSHELSNELFEKTMDMLEKMAYTRQRDEFTVDELEEIVHGFDSVEVLKAIYQHWKQKRQRKGMPLIRHFQPPLWERYQQQVKLWEEAVARTNTGTLGACKEKSMSMEKPPMFAFCLKPRGLEVLNKGSKQRSQRRFSTYGHHQAVHADQDGLHTYGRRLNGFNEEKIVFSGRSNEFLDASPSFNNSTRVFSPRDGGGNGFLQSNGHASEWNHYRKLRKNGALTSPSYSESPYSQRTSGMRNGVHRWNVDLPDWPSQKTQQNEGPQKHGIGHLDGSDFQEFRLIDASGEAQHARKVAKWKRERAQRLLYRADLAIHKAVVALMTAEAIKASFDSFNGDG